MLATLKQIREHIKDRGLGVTIHDVKKLCADNHLSRVLADVEAVENDYDLLTRFFENGFEDPERVNLYHKLELRIYNIILLMITDSIGGQNATYKQCRINAYSMPREYENIEETLSRYDQELALSTLDENADEKQKNIHQRLLCYRIFLFNLIYTSQPWTQTEADSITKVLLSPLVDVIDQQIILGAMLMAQRTVFDALKFAALCRVVSETDNEYVRSRALIAIVLALPDGVDGAMYGNILNQSFDSLLAIDGMKQDMVDIQTQLLLCMETMQNEKTINTEILPTLLKNSQKMMIDKETDEEKLDSLLHPDLDEQKMEEVEASIDKMRNMQKNGADVFFSSFSHAKRFSFFYTLMNWFCPFYIEHPQVATSNFKDMPMDFLRKITVGEMFCNSDKYSFILSLAQVIAQIPKEMVDMMQKGEVAPLFDEQTKDGAAFVRRSYLNDLYRFFNLYSDKGNFRNPFATDESVCFFLNDFIKERFANTPFVKKVSRQLLKHHCYNALESMLVRFGDENDPEWLKLYALCYENRKEYDLAADYFSKALSFAPDNKLLLSRSANAAFLSSDFDLALDLYKRYLDLTTEEDDTDVENYRMALCELKLGQTAEAMSRLFRLSYNEPENPLYHKALALGYLSQKKFTETLTEYERMADNDFDSQDFLRMSIALWMNRRNSEAVMTLRQFVRLYGENKNITIYDKFYEELENLGLAEEYHTEAMILMDLALKDKL